MKVTDIDSTILIEKPLKTNDLVGEKKYGEVVEYENLEWEKAIKKKFSFELLSGITYGFVFLDRAPIGVDAIFNINTVCESGCKNSLFYNVFLTDEEKKEIHNKFT